MRDLPDQEDRAVRAKQVHEDAEAVAEEARRRAVSAEGRLEATRLILRSLDDDLSRLRRGITVAVLARLGRASARHDVARRRVSGDIGEPATSDMSDPAASMLDLAETVKP